MCSALDWQNACTNNFARMSHILTEKEYADCKFLVGVESDQEEISGHKLILSIVSPVFGKMLYGSFDEQSDLIKIPDIRPKIFQSMMEWIYSEKFILTSTEDICDLSYAAKKYLLNQLDEHCINYLKKGISKVNVCQIYEFAELCSELTLMELCKKYISVNYVSALKLDSFLSVKLTTVMMILDLNLSSRSEPFLFKVLHKYAVANGYIAKAVPKQQLEAVSNEALREQVAGNVGKDDAEDKALMREAVKKIRFLTMTPLEFGEGPGRSSLLTDLEGYAILLNISCPAQGTREMPEGFSLITRPKKPKSNFML